MSPVHSMTPHNPLTTLHHTKPYHTLCGVIMVCFQLAPQDYHLW